MSRDFSRPVTFSRRQFFKAAAVAVGALSGPLVRTADADEQVGGVPCGPLIKRPNVGAQWDGLNLGGGYGDIRWGWGQYGQGTCSNNPLLDFLRQFHDEWNCFLRGTLIRGVNGYRAIEDLAVGDVLMTHFSGAVPIRKIIRYAVSRRDDGHWPDESTPVRIRADAFSENVPARDLFVSDSHAIFLGGALVPVESLINGKTIFFDERMDLDVLEYFHVQFGTHDVIEAEGLLCESHRDETMELCAPLALNGGRSRICSHLRSAMAPFLDRRQPLDRIRDGLETRAGF